MIGSGATIIQDLNIGDNTIIGAGAVVVKNIPSDVIIVPASTLRDGRNVFLDDTNVEYIETQLSSKVIIQEIDGYAMIETILYGATKG